MACDLLFYGTVHAFCRIQASARYVVELQEGATIATKRLGLAKVKGVPLV